MTNAQFCSFVLSIYPTTRGFAFVVNEGPESPFDWGTKEFRGPEKNTRTLDAIGKLIDRYRPDALVIEDFTSKGNRRSPRIRRLYRSIMRHANNAHVDVFRYSQEQVKSCFAPVGATTKHEIAIEIARHIPAFEHRLPRLRKIWMSEDSRQSLFDAAALGLAHYSMNKHDTF